MKNELNEKHFFEWMKIKEELHNIGKIPAIKEGEIWWAALGENVGVEINGKHKDYSRPVIVFRKLSRFLFLGDSTYISTTYWYLVCRVCF